MAGKNLTVNYELLIKWLDEAIEKINNSGITQEFHISEILPKNALRSIDSMNLLQLCCGIFDGIAPHVNKLVSQQEQISIYLNIDLEGNKNSFSGSPESIDDLNCISFPNSIPEIIVYKEIYTKTIPSMEFYRAPLVLDIFSFENSVSVFYKEYRSYYDLLNSEDYVRELNLVIQ